VGTRIVSSGLPKAGSGGFAHPFKERCLDLLRSQISPLEDAA